MNRATVDSERALRRALDRVMQGAPAADEGLPARASELGAMVSDALELLTAIVRATILTPGASIADLGPTDPASIVPIPCPLPGYSGVVVHFRTDAPAVVAFCTLHEADSAEASLMAGCRMLALLMPRIEHWASRKGARVPNSGKRSKHSEASGSGRHSTPDDLTVDDLKGYIPLLTDEVFLKWATTRGYPLAIQTQPDAYYTLYGAE